MQSRSNEASQKKTKGSSTVSRVGIIDRETGEVIDGGRMIYVPPKLRIKGFFMANQDGFADLAKSNLTGEAFKVLMLMMSRMDYENAITISQKEIATTLEMKKQNVSRAVKSLRNAGVFEKETDHVIHLATELGWKGKVQNLRKRQSELFRAVNENTRRSDEDWAAMDERIDALPEPKCSSMT
ncbi:MAG: helix-turn-helix domain-containing protein [Rhodoferax sp.]|nr:helix-turn-helix domain-containing protein [Rhodoferax sp.]